MKFGKEFASQMVPEWHEAYINYSYLKILLKEILHIRLKNARLPSQQLLTRKQTLYRTFSGLTSRYHRASSFKKDDEAIVVSTIEQDDGLEDNYRTTFLMVSDEGGDYEHLFFEKLDGEFNKVLKFYKTKEEEMIKEAEKLSKQMDALIALRVKVDCPKFDLNDSEDNASSAELSSHWQRLLQAHAALREKNEEESGQRKSRVSFMDVIDELEKNNWEVGTKPVKEPKSLANKERENNARHARGPTEVLDNVKINLEPETPASTLKNVLKKNELSFSKKELIKVTERMRLAFVEFYQKLRFLKSYCFLNQLALSKIMKKYDKVTSRQASRAYLEMVDKSYIGRSDKVLVLMERVEATFIKHFANGNRHKGMRTLRPQKTKREKHRVTYFLGFFSGCSLALLVALILIVHARDVLQSEGRERYMENIFPLYSFFGYIVLHMVMFAGNIYYWKRFRVNYAFIFGFKPGTELGYREVLLLSSGLSVLTLAAVLSNLDMDMDPRTRSFQALTELVPLGLVIVLLLIMFCPFDIIYRENRFFFIKCIWHCLCAPLYKVTLPDFFLADQLTSQVQAIRNLLFYVCYYGWGDFKRRSSSCRQSSVFQTFYIIVALIPYWSRCLQCARRLVEEGDSSHIINGLKYFSTIIAVVMRTTYDLKKGFNWKIMAAVTSFIATIFSTYWDVIKDWGLLQHNSRNPWLREKLLVPYKSVYYVAMIVNVVLRLAWMQSVLDLNETSLLHRRALPAVVASMEIIRRGMWNFFRLENEHLNNVGKYRAFKSVPLPFNFRG
ncbi:hypothetical protein LguiB_019669 [Lonicera macranthoides]